MVIATVIIGIFTAAAFGISLFNSIKDHWKSVDFFAEIKYIKKNGKRVHDKNKEEVNLYLVNKGCPITIMEILYDQTQKKKDRKLHILQLPARLERGQVVKIPIEDLPEPFNFAKIEGIKKDNLFPCMYAKDSFGKKRYIMKINCREAPPHQPNLSKSVTN